MFTEDVSHQIRQVAEEFGYEPAALLAIAEVESGGRAFAKVDDRLEPAIRFEGHYFDRRLSGSKQTQARAEGLASPIAGKVQNPSTQAARWKLLARAAAIEHKAAHESVSWGLGQVMGAHWAWLGFANVEALVAEARSGAAGQARLMARYIDRAGLSAALRARDWEAFAKGYNGPGYRKFSYHAKLAAAYKRHAAGNEPKTTASGFSRRGSQGDTVRSLQLQLSSLGYPVSVDAIFGAQTKRALREFQSRHGLDADGIAGPATMRALSAAADSKPDCFWSRLGHWFTALFGRLS